MKKYLMVLLSAVMIISCTVVLAACDSKENNKPNTPSTPQEQTLQLTTPSNLTLNSATVYWTAVANANGYTVRVGTAEHQVASDTTFDLSTITLAEGTYQVSVKAVGQTVGNIRYTDSAYSASIDYLVKATVKEGTYRLTNITFDGNTYDVTKDNEARNLYKAVTAKIMLEYLQFYFPSYNFNSIIVLKFFFADEFDFTGITTAAQFWDAYLELLINTDKDVQDEFNEFIKETTTYHLVVTNNTIFAYNDSSLGQYTTFTLDDGVITLTNSSVLNMEDSILTYTDGVITETTDDIDFGFTIISVYKLIPVL